MDCGATCLRMIAQYYGRHYNTSFIRDAAGFTRQGVSLYGISEAAAKLGFRTRAVKLTYDILVNEAPVPGILHWEQDHFVVLLPGVSNSPWLKFKKNQSVKIADPAKGIITVTRQEFLKSWIASTNSDGEPVGSALLLEPGPDFYELEGDKENRLSWKLILQYIWQSRFRLFRVFIAILVISFLQLIFPFLTQSIVDIGINTHNLNYITLVLVAQLMLVFSRTAVDFIRNRLLLKVSMLVNISILSDFWIKLTRLPLSYFDVHRTGDTIQRISDNKVIKNFLTGSALNTLISLLNFIVFAIILILYNVRVFTVFAIGSGLYFAWIQLFLRIRKKINYQTFHISTQENNLTLQFVQGMQEIRINRAENRKRWEWENIQAKLFKLNYKSLSYSQFQQTGALLVHQGKDIIITFMVANLVISGRLTLGAMLAIQYIIGQLSGPIEQFIGFIQNAQDAKISMERINEIHQLEDEENEEEKYIDIIDLNKPIEIKDLSFSYPGLNNNAAILKNISFNIPVGKITAIVGMSGSGKTTLLKLLLKFYHNYNGEIKLGDTHFKHISPSLWRDNCGAVLQDGYIFNDTIMRNIVVGDENIDYQKLISCSKTANILSFIESLPNGFNTLLGANGVGISQGQKQRLLIARAIYKNPQFLFFDEATNALDANNERAIVDNLQQFFIGKTVVVVAHRLSTVRNADNIIVLEGGIITESGTHQQLSAAKGKYFELVKNQLELGS